MLKLKRKIKFMKDLHTILVEYEKKITSFKNTEYLNYPAVVTFETYAQCNASCSFCPYRKLQRKGIRMIDEVINKIISEMSDFPSDNPIRVVPVRVNEPFLDKRIIDICNSISDKIKNSQVELYSNGSILDSFIFKQLLGVKNLTILGISLNYHEKNTYNSGMKLSFEKTVKNIDQIYNEYNQGKVPFVIVITGVSNNDYTDQQFINWVSNRWPKFAVHILSKGDWLHNVALVDCDPVPNVGCAHWFSVNILSDGTEAFCCIDSEGLYGNGNISTKHLIDLYNEPFKRSLRETLPTRKSVSVCHECSFLPAKIIKFGKK